jgi:aspartate kinase
MNPCFKIEELRETRDEAMITIMGLPDKPGVAARLFRLFARESLPVRSIVQNCPDAGAANITFTITMEHFARASALCREFLSDSVEGLIMDNHIGRILIGGSDLENSSGLAAFVFETLGEASINILAIAAEFDSMSFILRGEDMDQAMRLLRRRFCLTD